MHKCKNKEGRGKRAWADTVDKVRLGGKKTGGKMTAKEARRNEDASARLSRADACLPSARQRQAHMCCGGTSKAECANKQS
jgi:hypothetical protein